MDYREKLKVIANVYENSDDKRSRDEVHAHMLGWFEKGDLSKEFIDGAYSAIESGRGAMFTYEPDKHYGYLTRPERDCDYAECGKKSELYFPSCDETGGNVVDHAMCREHYKELFPEGNL